MAGNNATHLILENICGFSKADHVFWTLFGDETRAYNPNTLEFVGSYADARFPDGMGSIQGWEFSVYSKSYAKYNYILADCEESKVPEETGEDYPGPIITVNRSIWLPVSELWGYDNNLRENPPTGFDKKRFINVVQRTISKMYPQCEIEKTEREKP